MRELSKKILLIMFAVSIVLSGLSVFSASAQAADSVFDITASVYKDGSDPFSASGLSGCDPAAATADAGNDISETDGCVRAGDVVSYNTRVSVNQEPQPGEQIKITLTLFDDDSVYGANAGQEWQSIPNVCSSASSSISVDKRTLECFLSDNVTTTQGTILSFNSIANVKADVLDASHVWFASSVETIGGNGQNTATGVSDQVEVTRGFRMDLAKRFVAHEVGTDVNPNNRSDWQNVDGNAGNGTEDLLVFNITGKLQKGSVLPNSNSFTINDVWQSVSGSTVLPTNATLVSCGLMGDTATGSYTGQFPYGAVGVNGSATSTNSVANSGTVNCTTGSSPRSLTITGTDLSTSYPTNQTSGSIVASSDKYLFSIYVKIRVPKTDLDCYIAGTCTGGSGVVDNYTLDNSVSFASQPVGINGQTNPTDASGEDQSNNNAQVSFDMTTPGSWNMRNEFRYSGPTAAGGGLVEYLAKGSNFYSRQQSVFGGNTGNGGLSYSDLPQQEIMCGTFDNTVVKLNSDSYSNYNESSTFSFVRFSNFDGAGNILGQFRIAFSNISQTGGFNYQASSNAANSQYRMTYEDYETGKTVLLEADGVKYDPITGAVIGTSSFDPAAAFKVEATNAALASGSNPSDRAYNSECTDAEVPAANWTDITWQLTGLPTDATRVRTIFNIEQLGNFINSTYPFFNLNDIQFFRAEFVNGLPVYIPPTTAAVTGDYVGPWYNVTHSAAINGETQGYGTNSTVHDTGSAAPTYCDVNGNNANDGSSENPNNVSNESTVCLGYHNSYSQDRLILVAAESRINIEQNLPTNTILEPGDTIPYTVTPYITGDPQATSATITVTLPAGVSYSAGSTSLSGTANGSYTSVQPVVTVNPDGTTTLDWNVTGVAVGTDMQQINFNGVLGSNEVSGTYNAVAQIQSPVDFYTAGSPEEVLHIDNVVVGLDAPEGYIVSKVAEEPVVETRTDLVYDLSIANTSSSDLSQVTLIDVFPYNDDCNSLTAEPTSSNGGSSPQDPRYECTSASPSGSQQVSFVDFTPFVSNEAGLTYDITCTSDAPSAINVDPQYNTSSWSSTCDGSSTALKVVVTGTIPANSSTQSFKLTLHPLNDANVDGDVYINSFASRIVDGSGTPVDLLSLSNDARIEVVGGSIGDTVWYDYNQDGVQDSNETGIPNVPVELIWYGPDGVSGGGDDVTFNTTTDPSGIYLFEGLPSGNYEVNVTPPTGVTQTYDLNDGTGPFATPNSTLVTIDQELSGTNTLIGVEDTDTADFGYVEYDVALDKTVSPSTDIQTGDVVAYTVEVFNQLPSDLNRVDVVDTLPTGLTNIDNISDGGVYDTVTHTITWSITGTPALAGNTSLAFTYEATVSSADGMALDYTNAVEVVRMQGINNTDVPDKDSTPDNMGSTPSEDDEDIVTLMPGGSASITGTVYRDIDRSQEFDNGDATISGVTVELLDSDGTVIATTITDEDGNYTFDGLWAGTYSVREVQPSNYVNQYTNPGDYSTDTLNQDDLISEIVLEDGQASADNNFGEDWEPISGTVYNDKNNNLTQDSDEPGLPGILVVLKDASGNEIARTYTDDNGDYTFPSVAPGDYIIEEYQPDGYGSTETPSNIINLTHGLTPSVDNNYGEIQIPETTTPTFDLPFTGGPVQTMVIMSMLLLFVGYITKKRTANQQPLL